MSIKHQEIKIPVGNAFQNCQLDRKKYATVLTQIINSYTEGFVLAINNKWGTGKTTFIKMWKQSLEDDEFKTVYFNAWENDFENNPLTALMGELKSLSKSNNDQKFNATLKKAAVLSKHLAPLIAKALAEKYINIDGIKEGIIKTTEGLADIFENDVKEYTEKKKGISEFKKTLSEFIVNNSNDKPLIFIIDELDRCRPDYAVSILEQIKHFFSVPNIVFVLSIDKEQLGNAIKGVYGSENINAEEYLRRFIDIEYSIPEPEQDIFSKYLYSYFDFDSFFNSPKRTVHNELKGDKRDFQIITKLLLTINPISLRQQEKIFAHSRLVLRTFPDNYYVIPEVYFFLIMIKITNENFYYEIKNKKLDIQTLQQKYHDIISHKISEETEYNFLFLEANLVQYYHNYIVGENGRKLFFEPDGNGGFKGPYNSIVQKSDGNQRFYSILQDIERSGNSGRLNIGYFINRIELTEAIIS